VSEGNKAVVQRFLDALTRDELDVLTEVCTPEVAKAWSGGIQQAPFSDHHLDVKEMVAEDDKVMVVVGTRFKITGDFHGISGTGQPMTNKGAGFFRLADGRITELEIYFDDLHLVTELGATITQQGSAG
jgi:ketosteroid isomerase-like protein